MRHVVTRIIGLVPTLLLLVTAAFFVIRLAPGGPFDDERPVLPQVRANLEAAYGLDAPLTTQYLRYVRGLLHGDLGPSFKMLSRVSRIQAQLTQSWDVLATMTPAEYSAFRNQLGRASGFQSYQYRMLEFIIGNKNADMIEVHKRDPQAHDMLVRTLRNPSIYDESLRLLSRRGFGQVQRCGCLALALVDVRDLGGVQRWR